MYFNLIMNFVRDEHGITLIIINDAKVIFVPIFRPKSRRNIRQERNSFSCFRNSNNKANGFL